MSNADLLPGIARIRARFVGMLGDRLSELESLVAGGNGIVPEPAALNDAKAILHKIAGSAGTLGLQDLGEAARTCENDIICYLDTGAPGLPKIFNDLGDFAELAEDLLEEEQPEDAELAQAVHA